jgi:N-acetylmuramoyl-L-alanine amidase
MSERMDSPNFGARIGCDAPDMVVLHYTAMESCAAAIERLRAPAHEVSAHYVIGRDGRVVQLVDEEMRAWHAGVSAWGDVRDINSRSIGIELDNAGSLAAFVPFSDVQMGSLEALLRSVMVRWSIAPRHVLGHSDVAVGRKSDPGAKFDWGRLAALGLAHSVEPVPDVDVNVAAFEAGLHGFGYRGEGAALLEAFRLRWRQGVQGSLDERDMGIAAALAMS